MPKDDKGYPVMSYYDEVGQPRMTYEEKQAAREREQLIDQGGDIDWGLTWDDLP